VKNRNQENLKALFERFMPASDAEAAADEVDASDAMLRAYPAPEPSPEIIVGLKLRIAGKLADRYRPSHPFFRFVGVAAAVIVVALIGFFGRSPHARSDLTHAALIPTAIWESDDIASDDLDIAYFASEIRQIETEMRTLEAGESETVEVAALDEVEMELMRINTEFWKE
jgi:hypothetical protein